MFAFGSMAYLIFSDELFQFRHPYNICLTMIRHIAAPMDGTELGEATVGFGGSIYNIMNTVFMSFVLFNVVLAIILKAWDDVNEANAEKKNVAWFPRLTRFLQIDQHQELKDPKDDWLEQEEEWKKVYPAGCPNRRLKHYLVNQLDIDEEDAMLLMEFVDTDKSGTVAWGELRSLMRNFRPNIENRNFALRRKHTNDVQAYTSTISNRIQQLRHEKKRDKDNLTKKVYALEERLTRLLNKKKEKGSKSVGIRRQPQVQLKVSPPSQEEVSEVSQI